MPAVHTAQERSDLAERARRDSYVVWPEYNTHGDVLNRYWSRMIDEFPQFQYVLYDDETEEVLGEGHSLPCVWDGTIEGLPAGIDAVAEGIESAARANTLSAMAIEILPPHQGRGYARLLIDAMRAAARRHGLRSLIAPVRPSWKERYPLTPIARYASWTRDDGLPFDPWIRLHVRLGGEILTPVAHSMRITGTVAEWESWTEMPFPETGTYVFPRGLAPLRVDRERDLGSYWEPNVWVRHDV